MWGRRAGWTSRSAATPRIGGVCVRGGRSGSRSTCCRGRRDRRRSSASLVCPRDLRGAVGQLGRFVNGDHAARDHDTDPQRKSRAPIWDPIVADGVVSGHEQSFCSCEKWGGLRGLNPQPSEPQSDALPIELRPPRSQRAARPGPARGTGGVYASAAPGRVSSIARAAIGRRRSRVQAAQRGRGPRTSSSYAQPSMSGGS